MRYNNPKILLRKLYQLNTFEKRSVFNETFSLWVCYGLLRYFVRSQACKCGSQIPYLQELQVPLFAYNKFCSYISLLKHFLFMLGYLHSNRNSLIYKMNSFLLLTTQRDKSSRTLVLWWLFLLSSLCTIVHKSISA